MAHHAKTPQRPRAGPSAWSLAAGAGLVGVLLGGAAVYLGAAERRQSSQPPTPQAPPRESPPPLAPLPPPPARTVAATVAEAAVKPAPVSGSLVDAVATTRDAVVSIGTIGTLGAGVIVDAEGTILTNYHVIADSLRAPVRGVGGTPSARPTVSASFQDGRELPALVVFADAGQDLAILRLISTDSEERFSAVALGASEKVQVGQEVFAIGNPFGLSHTVSRGIVSAVDRTTILPNRVPLLQLDASINVGNSGGPLFDLSGQLLGIVTAKRAEAEGIAFAVPVNHLRGFLRAVADPAGGRRSGTIGILMDSAADLPDHVSALGYRAGLPISEVSPGWPAASAGLKEGDVLVSVRGKRLDGLPEAGDPEALGRTVVSSVRSLFPGERLDVSVVREGALKTVSIEVGAATPTRQAMIDAEEFLGLQLTEDETGGGPPRVGAVLPGTPFSRIAPRLVGARVVKIMQRDIGSVEDLGQELARVRSVVRSQQRAVQVLVGFADDAGAALDFHVRVD